MKADSAAAARTRVLIADDERIIASTLRDILQGEGFEVRTVHSGAKAIEAAQLWHPQIFLSDVLLPDLSGVEAAICIRALLPWCRIVLLTARAASMDLVDEARLRGHDFQLLLKPIHPTELLTCLDGAGPEAARK